MWQFLETCRQWAARFLRRGPIKSVELYRPEIPYWLTNASISDKGDLIITSGDTKNEWSMIVSAGDKATLLKALRKRAAVDEAWGAEADARLLRALSARFAGRDAFERIRAFLEQHAIPVQDSNWLWADDC